jgi:hypothetical protein
MIASQFDFIPPRRFEAPTFGTRQCQNVDYLWDAVHIGADRRKAPKLTESAATTVDMRRCP